MRKPQELAWIRDVESEYRDIRGIDRGKHNEQGPWRNCPENKRGKRECPCYCSVAQPCLTLCNPMDCSSPGLPVHHQLPEFTQTHVHCVSDAIHPVIPFSSHLQSFPASGSLPMNQLCASGGQSIRASASVLSMNIHHWFPLGWTGWISLQSKGLWRVFSNTTVQKHQFFALSLLYGPTYIFTWLLE